MGVVLPFRPRPLRSAHEGPAGVVLAFRTPRSNAPPPWPGPSLYSLFFLKTR